MAESTFFITYGSNGVVQWNLNGKANKLGNGTPFNFAGGDDPNKKPTDIFISQNGKYFAIATKESLKLYNQNQPVGSVEPRSCLELPVPDARQVNFSPKGNFVAVNAPLYTVNDNNLKIFDMRTGNLLIGKPFSISYLILYFFCHVSNVYLFSFLFGFFHLF